MGSTVQKSVSSSARLVRGMLVAVELFVAVGAVFGGIGLVANNAIGMLPEWLDGTPFQSWVLPGVFLFAVVALPMSVAAVAELGGFGGLMPLHCWPGRRRWAGSPPNG